VARERADGSDGVVPLSRRSLLKTAGTGLAATLFGSAGTGAKSATTVANTGSDPYRPNFHFSPADGWMNDPNGMVYHEGEYHLFYQAGEDRRRWDHAVSEDLVTWSEQGRKIPDEGIQAFSGGAVVDEADTSGFGENSLVAMYTGHHDDGVEDQRVAYSTNRGRVVSKADENPVIPSDVSDFRDPNPFWYAPDGNWRMVVARVSATTDRPRGIEIYESPNLTDWTYLSTYESGDQQWECPSLYKLPVEGTDRSRWVMTVSVEWNHVEHHVGHFDGTDFVVDERVRADHGHDFYGGQSWANTPDRDGLLLSWMNHWDYATDLPDNGWRGAQTVPRNVTLVDEGSGVEVRQRPVDELTGIRQSTLADLRNEPITDTDDPLAGQGVDGDTIEILATIDPGSADAVGLRVRESDAERTVVEYDAVNGELIVDRSESGEFFSADNYGVETGPLSTRSDGTVRLRVLVDRSSVEVFANDGRHANTNLIFPAQSSTGTSMYASGGEAELVDLVAYDLNAETEWDAPGVINVGGDEYSTHEGDHFRYDQYYANGAAYSFDDPIDGTYFDRVYQTERVHESLRYDLPLEDGTYDVGMHFAENAFTATGDRVFDVAVEGDTVLRDLDIYAEAGHDAALVKSAHDVAVTDGDGLTIDCTASVDNAKFSALEVTSSGDVNAGGDFYTAGDGTTYGVDRYFSGGGTYSTADAIANTDDDALYQTERTDGTLAYEIPVGNGVYDVDLHFAEIYFESADQRVFDVFVQDELVRSDLDIYAEVGHDAALVETVEGVGVHDDTLTVTLDASVDNAKLSAVTVTPAGNLNVGGEAYTASDGTAFGRDRHFGDEGTYSTADAIANTDDDALYRTERSGDSLDYHLPLENGTYDVDLHFAEIYFEAADQRVFDVYLQGDRVLSDLDVFAEVGHDAALVETVTDVSVTDGALRISADASVDNAKLSAVEVRRQ